MWQKLSHNRAWAALFSGLAMVLAFAPIDIFPLVFLAPALLNLATLREPRLGTGFRFGFLTSLVIMLGAFYWVTYVIHVFGYLPWSVSGLLFMGFCGFGALNLPVFAAAASWIHLRRPPQTFSPRDRGLWFAIGLPALFTLVEFFVPKLFPWSLGHFFYRVPLLIQIVELTGCTFLSFATYSLGSVLGLWLSRREWPFWKPVWAIPLALWAINIGFGALRLTQTPPPSRQLSVGLIQANIGSLEKVEARHGVYQKVRYVIDRYETLTEQALASEPRPELLVWPETAIPFQLDGGGPFVQEIRNKVLGWKMPLIAGAYAPSATDQRRDYNAAYLLDPKADGSIRTEIYPKNILLAYGEYMPLGDTFPILYEKFPEVSNFLRGTTQPYFTLADGTRLGVTICYEAIVPEFYRKITANGVQAVVNITNDSWFGPTSEPYQHGALTIFRAVEYRAPLFRVTNTGTSFSVDRYGRMSNTTGVYVEGTLNTKIEIPLEPQRTLYLMWGEWFIIMLTVALLALTAFLWKSYKHVPVPV